MKKKFPAILSVLLIPALVLGCSATGNTSSSAASTAQSVDYSHANDTAPDYAVVLPDEQVNQINITISPENWEAVQADMTVHYGPAGSGERSGAGQPDGAFPGGGQPGARPDGGNPPQMENGDFNPPEDGQRPQRDDNGMAGRGGMGGGLMGGDDDQNPIWVEARIDFNGQTWEHVGFRLKGNSSLRSSWSAGSSKLPFKLDFDQFENDYPETENQRFYGFKQLSFSSNFADSSYLRETVAADLFRAAGVPSAQTAFYAVYVDSGDGPVYCGLYTAVEVVDDTLIQTQFTDDSGNVYKPSGSAATFSAGSYNEAGYDKETNQNADDYSDVQALLETLNSDLRQSDPAAWRAQLETVFDVDEFLQWLAANTVMQNWDTYGSMAHNYYLYHDPSSEQLVWIPWDNNQSLGSRGGGRGGNDNVRPGGMGSGSTSIGNEDVGETWPLIAYLLDDAVYQQRYVEAVQNFLTVFDPDALESELERLHEMIAPYVEAEQPGATTLSNMEAFEGSVEGLMAHIRSRYDLAQAYLEENS
ncbi:MAG: spore coat protein [Chloroflexota bacterium]|nr:spore coat protein [Chloroflexota bacterium]